MIITAQQRPKRLNFSDNIQTILKFSSLSRSFPGYRETFQTIRKLPTAISRVTRKNFPDAQILSRWQCHDATMVFVPLQSLGLPLILGWPNHIEVASVINWTQGAWLRSKFVFTYIKFTLPSFCYSSNWNGPD